MASSTLLDCPMSAAAFAFYAGVSLHLAVFIRGEWEKHISTLVTIELLGPVLLFASLYAFHGLALYHAALTTTLLVTSFYTGLFGSITVYRLVFHPLRNFYGPVGAKLTAFWTVKESIPDLKFYLKLQRLHKEHGDFIRIRPREISINNVEAVQQIYGHSSKCSKGPLYDINYPSRSLQMTRDKKFHGQRRRIWDKAFNARAMKDYEQRLMKHFEDFATLITASKGKPINATDVCEYWGFDVMGDLMFGRSFNMLKENKPHFALNMFRQTKPVSGVLVPAYWTFMLMRRLPFVSTVESNWLNWCKAQLEERRKNIPQVPDLYTYILGGHNEKTAEVISTISDGDAASDAELAIVAGSDTSSSALAASIYLLAKHRNVQCRLQQEIDQAISSAGGFSHQALVNKPLLEGIINEALRLYPPVPGGLQRLTPPEGGFIAGRFLPGDTLVSVPHWSLHRDPRNFPQPDEFIPERWFSRPELVVHKEAFIPFSAGSYSCVGKPLAMMEMRLAVALVARNFEITLQDEVESVRLFEESPGWQDAFVAKVPPVRVCFRTRH